MLMFFGLIAGGVAIAAFSGWVGYNLGHDDGFDAGYDQARGYPPSNHGADHPLGI